MPNTVIVPEGTSKPIAPYSLSTLADGIVYVSGILPFNENNNVHVGDANLLACLERAHLKAADRVQSSR
jgi:aminoacrylate peracid reductase